MLMITEIGALTSYHGKIQLKMWQVNVPPGKRPLHNHFHERFEIMMVKEGGGTYTTLKKQYPICPGDIFVFSSNEMHCITDVSNTGLVITNLHFDPFFLSEFSGDKVSLEHNNFCYCHNESFENRIPKEKTGILPQLFSNIASELTRAETEYAFLCKAYLDQIVVSLIRNHGYSRDTSPVDKTHLLAVRNAIAYINNHLTEKITLKEIADVAAISPAYFSTLFKRTCNINLWDYITSQRINKVIQLLASDPKSETMLEIALQCGFNNSANFNKAFKRHMGMTPREFIKSDLLSL